MSNPSDSALAFAGPIVTAQLAWSALRGHGIEAVLLSTNSGTMFQPDTVQVVVPRSELPRALEVLVEMGLTRIPAGESD